MEHALIITSVGLLVFLAHLFAAFFEKTRMPDVLPLVFIGLFIGPIAGLVHPEAFGEVGSVFTTVALVLILFESGLGLRISVLRRSMVRATTLTLLNFAGAIGTVAVISIFWFDLSVLEGLIIGSVLGATAPAVIVPLASKLPFGQGTRTTLILESIFGEGFCIVLTLSLLQALKTTGVNPTLILGEVIASFSLAAALGAAAAFLWSNLLSRVRELENSTFTTPAFVFIVYGVAELLGYIGPIAAFAFGIVLGNIKKIELPIHEKESSLQLIGLNRMEKAFFGEVVFLLKTFFFVYIGLSARLTDFSIIVIGVGLTIVIFLTRIATVFLAMDRKCYRHEATLVAAMAPRGLAAAVLASIILQSGITSGEFINNIVYLVITISIIATTVLTFLIEKTPFGALSEVLFSKFANNKNNNKDKTK